MKQGDGLPADEAQGTLSALEVARVQPVVLRVFLDPAAAELRNLADVEKDENCRERGLGDRPRSDENCRSPLADEADRRVRERPGPEPERQVVGQKGEREQRPGERDPPCRALFQTAFQRREGGRDEEERDRVGPELRRDEHDRREECEQRERGEPRRFAEERTGPAPGDPQKGGPERHRQQTELPSGPDDRPPEVEQQDEERRVGVGQAAPVQLEKAVGAGEPVVEHFVRIYERPARREKPRREAERDDGDGGAARAQVEPALDPADSLSRQAGSVSSSGLRRSIHPSSAASR